MKKRFFALFLSLCVIIAMTIPTSAFAGTQGGEDPGNVMLSGPTQIIKDKSKDSYDVEYTAVYTMSKYIADKINDNKEAIAGAGKDAEFGFIVKLDPRLTAKNGDKYSYKFEGGLFDVDEANVEEKDGSLYVPCTLANGWDEQVYGAGQQLKLTATAYLPADKFAPGKTLETTGSVQVKLGKEDINIDEIGSVKTEMIARIPENMEPGKVVLTGPTQIVKDKSKASYNIEYKAVYTMSEDIADVIETYKDRIVGAAGKNDLQFGFIVKLDPRLTAQNGDKYSYKFEGGLFDVDEANVEEKDGTLYVPCTLANGWNKIEYKAGYELTLTATAYLPADKFAPGKTLETTGSVQVKLPSSQEDINEYINIDKIGTVETKMVAKLPEKIDPGKVELSGTPEITEDKKAADYDVEYKAVYTMSEDIADAIETYKDVISGAADNATLQFGFIVKLDPRLAAQKDGKYSFNFDSTLFDVDDAGVKVTDEGLYVPCKLKKDWDKTVYSDKTQFTLTAKAVLPKEKFEGGKSLNTTGEVKVTLPNGEVVSIADVNTVVTEMKAIEVKPAAPTLPSILLMKAIAKGNNSANLTWTKVKGADGYDVYKAKCNVKQNKEVLKLVKSIKGQKLTYKVTKLSKGVAYKYRVDAYKIVNGKKVVIAKSVVAHSIAGNTNKKYTNAKSVTLKSSSNKVTLKKGKSKTLKATTKKVKSSKKLLSKNHAVQYRYISSNPKVAKVNKNGKVTAVSKGTCKVYVITVNGIYATSKITVK
ncbi:MAG: Ig-like domain-containing protein [Bacillota bacterium]|nr:Ig-like domain-containing protein [Bacillota bacterium]